MTWTAERVEILKNHTAAGLSATQIGEQMRVSRNAVIGKARRAGIHITNYEEKRKLGILPPARKRPRPSANPGRRFFCTIMDLSAESCRWPIGDNPSADMLYCGAPIGGCSSYCGWHHAIAHRGPSGVGDP